MNSLQDKKETSQNQPIKSNSLDTALKSTHAILHEIIEHGKELVEFRREYADYRGSVDKGDDDDGPEGGETKKEDPEGSSETILTSKERSEIYGAIDRVIQLGRLSMGKPQDDELDAGDLEGITALNLEYDEDD